MKRILYLSLLVLIGAFNPFISALAQNMNDERGRFQEILRRVKDDVQKNYYDPTYKGIDVEAKYKVAKEKIGNARSTGQMNSIIAQFLVDFDDSHLFFSPPGRADKVSYGFDFRMVGDKCFVSKVDKESDAAKKGLQVGDELYSIEGYEPTRENLWKMRYTYFALRPRDGLSVVIIKPNGENAKYDINAKIIHGKRLIDLTGSIDIDQYNRESEAAQKRATRQYFYEKLDGIFIWKIPGYSLDPYKVDSIMDRVKKFPAVILDLRGNGGGRVDMLLRLLGNFFQKDIKVADEKRRKETKEMIAKSRGKEFFDGKIVVLIDSGSASASEIFARVIQIEKRGIVIGDRSAGAVMESMFFDHELGMDSVVPFGTSITVADLIMTDGRSLEKIGVIPDQLVLISGSDQAAKRDPVLAIAVQFLGHKLNPEEAGKIFSDVEDADKK